MLEKTQVRIVAGSLRGRRLTVVVHEGMRPTPQMVREALFSILGNAIPGRVFYDIFAGTGVVGLEAISRGATTRDSSRKDPRQVTDIKSTRISLASRTKCRCSVPTPTDGPNGGFPRAGSRQPVLKPPFPDLSEKAEGSSCSMREHAVGEGAGRVRFDDPSRRRLSTRPAPEPGDLGRSPLWPEHAAHCRCLATDSFTIRGRAGLMERSENENARVGDGR